MYLIWSVLKTTELDYVHEVTDYLTRGYIVLN